MWQINVSGVARVMEAISVANRFGYAMHLSQQRLRLWPRDPSPGKRRLPTRGAYTALRHSQDGE
jgi:hypothetical protein